jgi:hypothetical protein
MHLLLNPNHEVHKFEALIRSNAGSAQIEPLVGLSGHLFNLYRCVSTAAQDVTRNGKRAAEQTLRGVGLQVSAFRLN